MHEWTKELTVGEDTIDTQHKMFLQYINDLEKAGDTVNTYNDVSAMIIFMQDYSEKHFAYEEDYMRKINYPYLEKHQQIHHELTQQIDQFYKRLKAREAFNTLSKDVIRTMGDWFLLHISTIDQAYRIYQQSGQLIEI
jgi:hemerythrin